MSNNINRVMIVGGNFNGRGAEAMMLTVRDALAESIPKVELYALVFNRTQNNLYKSEQLHPVRIRQFRRPISTLCAMAQCLRVGHNGSINLEKAAMK
jgi:hypothetical protein